MKMIEPFNLAEMGHNSFAIQVITEVRRRHLLIEMRS
jgi:hypothetical protein